MTLAAGSRLGPYEILAPLGAGGMGEVYRVMGRRIKSGFYSTSCGPEDIAPTLALILGLQLQREKDSRLLIEMLSGN